MSYQIRQKGKVRVLEEEIYRRALAGQLGWEDELNCHIGEIKHTLVLINVDVIKLF